jgi:serine/threonine protein kinase/tetratricopeptide (TPR) repeat protein
MNDRHGASPPRDDVTRVSTSAPHLDTIGPYRLLQRLGEGGMGDVWLAEQTRPVHRQVALKVIKAGMDTGQVVARFEAERQALAVMDHPAIARVFDAGATPQGRPYFVMEYVRGEALTAYCARHKLAIGQRIDLFLQVCDGVQHAHQKGIIHRDLKPSNILVTIQDNRAVPKIIDFGVAKATSQSLTDRTLHTELGVLIGTPEYMSPEQAEMTGLDIDTRTDVYALGVVLYELLTGTLPFDSRVLREKGIEEIRRTIRELDPPRPSTRVITQAASHGAGALPTRELARELRGDLDWITMRALEKDRTRRYGSVSDFGADLHRHLDHLPVLASPPGTVYRVSKFARRHRLGVGVATAFVLLLIAFAATMAVQTRRIARERDRANREAQAAKAVSDFLVGLFKVSDPGEARGNSLTAREVLDKGARQIEETLSGQPAIRARLEAAIGTVYTNLGLYAAAESLLKRAVATGQLDSDSLETLATRHALANLYWYVGRYDDAEPLYLAVVGARGRLLGEEHRDTLQAEFDLASLYVLQKRWEVAEALLRRTLAAQQRTLGEGDLDFLQSLHTLASFYYRIERYEESLPISIKVVQLRTRILGENHPETLQSMHNLATTFEALRRYDDAEPLYLRTIEIRRQVLGDEHPELANTRFTLARMLFAERRYAESEQLALTAYPPMLRSVGPTHDRTVRIANLLAQLYDSWNKPDNAVEWRAKLPKEAAATSLAR